MAVARERSYNYNCFGFHVSSLLCETTAITGAWLASVWLRFLLNPLFPKHLSIEDCFKAAPKLAIVLGLWLLMRARYFRSKDVAESVGSNVLTLTEHATWLGFFAIAATFFSREFGTELSRSIVLLFFPASFIALLCSRYLLLAVLSKRKMYGFRAERIAVVGHADEVEGIVSAIRKSGPSVQFVGLIVPPGGMSTRPEILNSVLGTTRTLAHAINKADLHRLVIAERDFSTEEFQNCFAVSERMGVPVSRVLDLPKNEIQPRLSLHGRFGLPAIDVEPKERPAVQALIKRLVDVVSAAVLLILLSPALMLIALLIRLTSPGPSLYRSQRVGKGGRYFTFLKFRSMYVSATDLNRVPFANEKSGHIFKNKHDPRVTPIGRILRRFSIDELPQLMNVLQGEMSLVGPRPLPACDLDPDGLSGQFLTWAELRAQVLPGITGLWQIRGRSDLSFEDMVQLDSEYIHQWSLMNDFRVLLETPLVLLTGRGAY